MMMKRICVLSILFAAQAGIALGETTPVWQFWSPVFESHFYTAEQAERDWLLAVHPDDWTYEGVAYNAYDSAEDANVAPVFRFWSPQLTSHFYTIDQTERDYVQTELSNFWTYEDIAFYAYPAGSQPPGAIPVHRFWSELLACHFYCVDDFELFATMNYIASVWTDEGIAWYAEPAQSDSTAEIINGPYLVRPDTNSITVMWESDTATTSRVDYGIGSLAEAFAEDTTAVRLHKVELTGLAADTAYLYQVTSGTAVSTIGSFTTAASATQPFRLAVYGDSRSDPNAHAKVVAAIIDSGPEAVIHLGDMNPEGRYALWGPEFFTPAREMLRTTPLLPVPGNHDYNWNEPLWYFYFFDLPYGAGWYATTYGNTRLIALDTNADFSPGSAQYEWLVSELSSQAYNQATWHVVFFHHPAFTATSGYITAARGHSDDAAVKTHLVPLFEDFDVDVTFQGHSHAYERYEHNGVFYIVSGGGGSPLYGLALDVIPPIRQFGRSVYHHCTIDVDPAAGTLTVTAVDNTGQAFDMLELHH